MSVCDSALLRMDMLFDNTGYCLRTFIINSDHVRNVVL